MMLLHSSLLQHKLIVCACCIIHNWVIQDGHDEFFTEESNYPSYNHATKRIRQANEHDAMVTFRQQIADQMWQIINPTMLTNIFLSNLLPFFVDIVFLFVWTCT